MTLPNRADLIIEQGKTLKWWFAVRFPNGEIADLPALGYNAARFQVRPYYGGPVLLQLRTGNGGVVLGRMWDADESYPQRRQWSGYLWASSETTNLLQPWGVGVHELEIYNGLGPGVDTISVIRGTAVLERRV